MRKMFVLIGCLIFSASLFAQDSRGVSRAGRITRERTEQPAVKNDVNGSDILSAAIRFSDPSDDQVLSQGETGALIVDVTNNSQINTIEPILEFSASTSWSTNVQTTKTTMAAIPPGGTDIFRGNVPWDETFPSGSITYQVKAIDRLTGAESSPVQVTFQNQSNEILIPEIAAYNVDDIVPRTGISNPYAIAVVIGNKSYTHPDVPDVDWAISDASTMKSYLINMLGYREANVIYIENASKSDFELVFGTKEVPQGKLYNWAKPNLSDVFVYYSGHGAPDAVTKKAFFMPSNSDPNYVRIGGYPLDLFYTNLSKISAKSITVVLDACFSGASQTGMLIRGASPMYIDVEMPLVGVSYNLLTSSAGDEISSWFPESRHSLFTYYFLRAMRGEADSNNDHKVTLQEIGDFIHDQVPYMARRLYGREQTPTVKGQMNAVFCQY